MSLRVSIVLTCVPDYRLGLFDTLAAQIEQLTVYSGEEYFDPSIKDAAHGQPWSVARNSKFLLGRRFVWDERKTEDFPDKGVMICSWNPRNLSVWRDLFICRRKRIPLILWGHAHGHQGPQGAAFRFRHWLAGKADGVICYTETQAALTRKMLPHIPVIAAPNACLSCKECGVSGIESERNSLICVGRLVAPKKVALLFKGFALAQKNNSEFTGRLIIVGDGPERKRLQELAEELEITARIEWVGHESRVEHLRKHYSKAFVSVCPGCAGLSLTQSFAFGVPALIAKDEPHGPEVEAASEGDNALFFQADSPDALAKVIMESWHQWRGISEKREKLAKWTAENYSFETMADRFHTIALEVLSQH